MTIYLPRSCPYSGYDDIARLDEVVRHAKAKVAHYKELLAAAKAEADPRALREFMRDKRLAAKLHRTCTEPAGADGEGKDA